MPLRKVSPTQKVEPRDWGGDRLNRLMMQEHVTPADSVGGSLLALLNLLGLGLDAVKPHTKPQDVELPNPGGWATKDDRLKPEEFRSTYTEQDDAPRRSAQRRKR